MEVPALSAALSFVLLVIPHCVFAGKRFGLSQVRNNFKLWEECENFSLRLQSLQNVHVYESVSAISILSSRDLQSSSDDNHLDPSLFFFPFPSQPTSPSFNSGMQKSECHANLSPWVCVLCVNCKACKST